MACIARDSERNGAHFGSERDGRRGRERAGDREDRGEQPLAHRGRPFERPAEPLDLDVYAAAREQAEHAAPVEHLGDLRDRVALDRLQHQSRPLRLGECAERSDDRDTISACMVALAKILGIFLKRKDTYYDK